MAASESSVYIASQWGAVYHSRTENEVLGAGAAGPGKSIVLLWDPWQQIHLEHSRCQDRKHPYHIKWGQSVGHALHLRRTSPMLEETIARSKRWFRQVYPDADWKESDQQWTFPSGYKFTFGHCKDPDDWQQFQSNQYCVAKGTMVVMGDDSLRPIEEIRIGETVMTLEGPRKVIRTWAMGEQPCVEAVVRVHDAIVGKQTHPSTHPVLLSTSVRLSSVPSPDKPQSDGRSHPNGWTWQDYESLLCGRPASPVKRVSLIDGRSGTEVCCGLRLGEQPLPELIVPVVLHERTARRARGRWLRARGYSEHEGWSVPSASSPQAQPLHQLSSPSGQLPSDEADHLGPSDGNTSLSCDASCEPPGSRKATDSQESCWSSHGPHDGPFQHGSGDAQGSTRPPGDAGIHTPTHSHEDGQESTRINTGHISPFYPHFYSGEPRALTEGVRNGSMSTKFVGWRETFDLTVEGANHYITESGLIQAQTHIALDEASQFTEEQKAQIKTRLRTDDPILRQIRKFRMMSNPVMRKGGQSFTLKGDPFWLRKQFIDPWPLGKKVLYDEVTRADGTKEKVTRLYLPATLFDNPNKQFVHDYEAELLSAPPHIRQALLYGNWYITEGSYYAAVWDQSLHVCRPFKVPDSWRKFRAMDWGFKLPGIIGWYAMDDDDNLFKIREYNFQGRTDVEVAKRVKEIEVEMGLWAGSKERPGKHSLITGPADTQLWEKRGDSGKSKAEVFQAMGIQWMPADKSSREGNAQRIYKRLADHQGGTTTPGLVLFEDCKETIRTLPQIQAEEGNPECPQDGGDDHAHDETGYACAFASRGRKGIPPLKKDDEWDDDDRDPEPNRGRLGYGGML